MKSYGSSIDENDNSSNNNDNSYNNQGNKNEYQKKYQEKKEEEIRFRNKKQKRFILETTPLPWYESLIFRWIEPLLDKGHESIQLQQSDLEMIPLPFRCQTSHVIKSFEEAFEKEKGRVAREEEKEDAAKRNETKDKKHHHSHIHNKNATSILVWSLARSFGVDFLKAGLLKLVHDLCIFVGPIVLHGLIEYLRDPDAPLQTGLLLTLVVTASQLLMSFCLRHYFYRCYVTGLQMRSAVVVSIYKKALLLSSAERQIRTSGEIVNLISIDAQRIQDLTTYLHAVWYSFLQIGFSTFFLWKQLGPSCLSGVAVIIIMVPFTKYVAAWMGTIQKNLMDKRDKRVELSNEVLENMKVIKLQAWEDSFQTNIRTLRNTELRQLLKYLWVNSFSIMLWSAVPLMVALATFTTYILLGNTLNVASALTALALFDILRFPLFMLPKVINDLVEATISFKRVSSFLMCTEHTPWREDNILTHSGISICNGTFFYENLKPKFSKDEYGEDSHWALEIHEKDWQLTLLRSQLQEAEEKIQTLLAKENHDANALKCHNVHQHEEHITDSDSNVLALKRINFQSKPGQFIAVVGAVGSGKSSFINSILGEMQILSGNISVRGKLAFFSQNPFIMNDTLKNNILFGHIGEDIDEDKYQKAISCCALEHDLKLLPNGDLTEIGEKGVTLSGGQKARVSLARSVYHNASTFLLDDPLAAVDAHVGKHIFNKCIVDELLLGEFLQEKCVILVTNAIQYLSDPRITKILVFNDGHVAESGTFAELIQNRSSLFSHFVNIMNETGGKPALEGNAMQSAISLVVDDDLSLDNEDLSSEDNLSLEESISTSTHNCESAEDAGICLSDKAPEPSEHSKLLKKSSSNQYSNNTLPAGKLMTDEMLEREKGHVDIKVYLAWSRAAGGACVGILVIIAYAIVEFFTVMSSWWLTYWSTSGTNSDEKEFLTIYAVINLTATITMFVRVAFISFVGLRASRILFNDLLSTVILAPMSFFDTTPIGRIVNRFSKDMYTIDESLVDRLRSYLATLSKVISTIIVISSVTPYFTLCLVPILCFYAGQQAYFTKTYRELRRLDSVNRSPIYALLGETLEGISTIRAYGAQENLLKRMKSMLDIQQNAYYLTFSAQCWLGIRLELAGTLIILFACLCSVMHQHRTESFAGLAGLSISFALSVTQSLNWSVRMGSELEANMVAVERVQQYKRLQCEAPHYMESDLSLHRKWPKNGLIEFSSVWLRYRHNLPYVLKGLSLSIPSQSKVGVVGRTGAGKSTLMVSLLRMVELASGSIKIDGVDVRNIGLKLLRSKISVIPQDPVLFSGSIRSNLDPFGEYEDDKLIEVLEVVGLKSSGIQRENSYNSLLSASGFKSKYPVKALTDKVFEGGSNFSVGQRQLIVIGRALLSQAKIVIMDEATASVDGDTDARIQLVMKSEFKNSTCMIVAHRINTILDCDFILVMNDGKAAEFDSPNNLYKRGGLFKDLVDASEKEKET
eukprot:CAMPEP_0184860246 /NCGR_PEP_ID=MMETSP0580-20130426/5172_1 /TAXON_ID=1118495 /ORGANISM="Dactyliosolen fragilissimus" /LENGTH=1483 /DNA_ID=CAMNT_0027357283 /DNA_START=38 /DNA_END=4489 /DNA_ORIENTATION=-